MAATPAKRSGDAVTVVLAEAKPLALEHFRLMDSPRARDIFKKALRDPGQHIVIRLRAKPRIVRISFTLGTSHLGHEPIGPVYAFHGEAIWRQDGCKDQKIRTTMTFTRDGQLMSIVRWPKDMTIPPRLARRTH